MARPLKVNTSGTKHDINKATRLRNFRIQFVNKNLTLAARDLGISKSTLSEVERGLKPINMVIMDVFISKYNLNAEWLTSGLGDKQIKGKAKPTAATSLMTAHDEILNIKQFLKGMEARETSLWNRLDALQKRMDRLEEENNGLKILLKKHNQ